jgi:IclR family mhp operon transcriptional activator
VKAITRALAVLRTLNRIQQGTISDLHKMTGIPKPTIVRALETLMSEGYVARDSFSCGYRTTSQVQELSCGFAGTPLIIEAARSRAIALTEQTKWPVSIGSVVDGSVVISFSTAPISPYGFPFPTLNKPFPVTDTAMGRCYISFCSEKRRKEIIKKAFAASDWEHAFTEARIDQTIAEVRERGYALQDPFVTARMYEEAHQFQFIAVPVMSEGECIACLGVGFYKRAIQPQDLEKTLVEPVMQAVAKIEQTVELLKKNAAVSHRM